MGIDSSHPADYKLATHTVLATKVMKVADFKKPAVKEFHFFRPSLLDQFQAGEVMKTP